MSEEEFEHIFKVQSLAANTAATWEYNMRRQAQSILPYIYLGPSVAAKNRAFLKQEGITMLLAIRSTQMTVYSSMLNLDTVAAEEGLVNAAIDVDGTHDLLPHFSQAIMAINDHLLQYHREQTKDAMKSESHKPLKA